MDGGHGVNVYVINLGINIHHVEFQGHASWGTTTIINNIDEDVVLRKIISYL